MLTIILILYFFGMILTDKYLANSVVDGIEEGIEECIEDGSLSTNDKFINYSSYIVIIFSKIFIPLVWPISWLIVYYYFKKNRF